MEVDLDRELKIRRRICSMYEMVAFTYQISIWLNATLCVLVKGMSQTQEHSWISFRTDLTYYLRAAQEQRPSVPCLRPLTQQAARRFNKESGQFNSKDEYDDYLELQETYIFNLTFGENVAETEAKIAEYQRVNASSIQAALAAQAGVTRDRGLLILPGSDTGTLAVSEVGSRSAADVRSFSAYAQTSAPVKGAVPVPVGHFAEDADGRLRGSQKAQQGIKPTSWREVAAASGWNPKGALRRLFKGSVRFWL